MLDRRQARGALVGAVVSVFAVGPVDAQMTNAQADRYLANCQAVFDRPAMKRVLTADRAELTRLIGGPDGHLAAYAVNEARRRRDPSLAPALLARVADQRSEALSAAAAAALEETGGDTGWRSLRRALADRRAAVRVAAALVVARTGDRSTIPTLREGLDRPDGRTRVAAASLLSTFGDMRSVPRVIRLADELNDVERRLLCNPLGRFGDSASRRKLLAMLTHERYGGTRARAALALGVRGNRSAVPALTAALSDRSADVRYAAAKALGAIGDGSAVRALEKAASLPVPARTMPYGMERRARAAAAEAVGFLTTNRGAAPTHAPADLSRWSDANAARGPG